MKHLILTICAALLLSTGTAPAAIVLDEAPPVEGPSKPRIEVPKPKDAPTSGAAAKSEPEGDVLRFLNKDILHGTLLGYDKEGGLRWQTAEAKEPIPFRTTSVSEIKLDSRKAPEAGSQSAHAIGLTNDDELPGNIVTLDDQTLVLDTWYAGKLTIPRAMLRRIMPLKATASTIYEGPTSMEGWVIGRSGNRKSWTYRDGALVSTNYGTIGRDVKLPPIASVEFDMVFRGNSQANVCLYTDKADNISNCYMLQMSNGYFHLQRYSRDGGSNNVGEPAQLGSAMRRDKTRIGLRVNKETKTISLFINGKMMKQWTDPVEFAGTGTALLFSGQSGTFVKISNIKVSQWDGRIEETGSGDSKSKEDSIKLANQDRVSGKLKTVANGKAQFASSYADLTIPLDRVEEIAFTGEGSEKAPKQPTDVRAYFGGRGSVTMQLESWDEKQATGLSPNFGKVTFQPTAFTRLQWNLDRQPAGDDDLPEMGGDEEN